MLFVNSQTELGGAEISLLTALRNLDRARIEPAVATLGFGCGDFPEILESSGIDVYRLRAGRARNPFAWAATILQLASTIRKGRFRIAVANGYHPHYYARPAAFMAGAHSVLFCRDHPQHPDSVPLVERVAFRMGCHAYFVASRTMKDAVKQRSGGNRPVHIVPNGIDMERLATAAPTPSPMREAWGFPAECLVITVVGRLQPWKGHKVFLAAARQVAEKVPQARFAIVGGALFGLNQGYPKELERLAGQLGIAEKTCFAGHCEDMPAAYAASDIVVLPSTGPEGFGRVAVEAMAASRPVVVSRAGAAAEIFEEGVSGLGVEPGDAAAMAANIIRLCLDLELRARLAAAGREHALNNYSAEHSALEMMSSLEAVADDRA